MLKQGFSGKVAVITGAASGLGRGLSEALAREGARLVVADVDLAGANEVAEGLKAQGAEVEAINVDVSDAAAVEALVERTVARFGRIDYMFNNAGIVVVGQFQDNSAATLQRVIQTNLLGAAYGTLFSYRRMIGQGFGHIVNIASMYALVPGPLSSSYVAAKHGLFGLTQSIMPEAAKRGVTLTLVCPGFIATNLFKAGTYSSGLNAGQLIASLPVKPINVETAVARTLKAVRAKKRIAVFPGYARALWWLQRVSPAALLWLLSMAARYRLKPVARDGQSKSKAIPVRR